MLDTICSFFKRDGEQVSNDSETIFPGDAEYTVTSVKKGSEPFKVYLSNLRIDDRNPNRPRFYWQVSDMRYAGLVCRSVTQQVLFKKGEPFTAKLLTQRGLAIVVSVKKEED